MCNLYSYLTLLEKDLYNSFMKKLGIILLVLSFFIPKAFSSDIDKEMEKLSKLLLNSLYDKIEEPKGIKVAVFEFTYYDGYKSEVTGTIQEKLIGYLSKDRNIIVLERQNIGKIFEEKKLEVYGVIDETQGMEFGKLVGADVVVFGTVKDFEEESEITGKMVEVKTGRVLGSETIKVKRKWERYISKPKEERKEQVYEYEIEFTLPKLTPVEIPEIKPLTKLEIKEDEIDKLEAYDEMIKIDRSEIDAEEKAEKWIKFSERFPEYKDYSFERANFWKGYKIKQKEYEEYLNKRKSAMKEDFDKLQRFLKLELITPKQKDELIEKFYQAYDYDVEEEYKEKLFEYEMKPCIRNKKMGFCYYDGSIAIEPKYDWVWSFSEGLAKVELNGKYGFIDKTGKEITPVKYDYVWSFSEGLAAVKVNGKWGFIDKTGKEITPVKYDKIWSFSEGLAAVEVNGKWGFIDKTGKEITPVKYDYVGDFSEGLAEVELNGKYGLIDKTGKEIIPVKYDYVEDFSEGLAEVELNGKRGLIDKTGKEITPVKYDYVWSFSEGLAAVRLNGKEGFIDKTGKEIIPVKYDYVESFFEGLATVKLNGKECYVDHFGNDSCDK